jgi:hypothetical protein
MKKSILLFVLALAIYVGLPMSASAQPGPFQTAAVILQERGYSGGYSVYGGGYNNYYGGYINPIYAPFIQQMMKLPEGLASCQLDFSTGKITSCRSIPKDPMAIQRFLENQDGLFATIHTDRGRPHVRLYDDTNRRIGRTGKVAIGTTAGAVGGGVVGGRKGAVIGAGIGAFTGWLVSLRSDDHDNCLVIEPKAVTAAGPEPSQTVSGQTQPTLPQSTATEQKLVRNNFQYQGQMVRVHDGVKVIAELQPGGNETIINLRQNSNIWFEVYTQNKRANRWEWVVLENAGVYELPGNSGWQLADDSERPIL